MKRLTDDSTLSEIAQQQFNLEMQMTTLNDVASDLESLCSWYDDSDPQYGGPPSKEVLEILAKRLRLTYKKTAILTGQDPCEKLDSTKARLETFRSNRFTD